METRYIIPYKYWRKSKIPLTAFEKRQYCKLYRRGIKPWNYYPNYQEIKAAQKDIDEIIKRIDLVSEYHLGSVDSCDLAINDINERIAALEEKKKIYILKENHICT